MLALRKLLLYCSLVIVVTAISFAVGKTIGTPPYATFDKHNTNQIGELDSHGISH